MSYEDEFDEIVRQKAGQAEYQFNENDWQKAGAMLDARNAAQKSALTKWLLPALFTVLTGVTAWIYFSPETSTNAEIVATASQQSQNKISVPEQTTSEKTEFTNKQSSLGDQPNKSQAITSNVEVIEATPVLAQAASAPQSKTVRTNKPAASLEMTDKTTDTNGPDQSKELNSTQSEETPSGSSVDPLDALPVSAIAAGSQSGGEANAKQDAGVSPSPLVPSAESEKTETAEVLSTDLLNAKTSNLLSELTDPDLLLLPFTMLKRYDDDYYQKTRHRQYLTIDGGGMYSFGWDTPGGKDGKGADYYVGVNYGYYLSRKISASLGFQMYSISNITQPFYNTQQKSYGFGYTSSYTSVTTDHMIFGSAPLRLNYHFTKFSAIGAGFNAGYLLQNHSRVDSYGVSDGLKGPVTSTGNYTVYESTSNINLMGSVFMSTRVHQRLGLNAEFVYGFTDLFKNNDNVSNAEKTIGVRLGITYYIFEK